MKIHCIKHVSFEGLANIETWIANKGHQISYTNLYEDEVLPDVNSFDFLIVMGGPMSFDDDEIYPWLKNEREFIRMAIDQNKILLGICLGAQIIAHAIDNSACHSNSKEIGWYPVYFENNNNIKGLDFLPEKITVFHWHADTFNLPEGAVRLASTPDFPNQAYIYKNNIIGLQFHMEMNTDSLNKMVEFCRDDIKPGQWVQDEITIFKGINNTVKTNELMWKILDYLENTKI